jgi:N6-L-threonylcarbamoyladenine synthase
MIVLGIESSCDESAAALYDSHRGILSHALHTQIPLHAQYGGVVPELASRDHVRKLLPLVDQAINQAKISPKEIDAIAYTSGPGLIGALMTGAALAKSLAFAWNKPALAIHHMEGHLLAPLLESNKPAYPFIALLVSGGHTQLMRINSLGNYQILGDTLDDAAGEAFDKTAKLLGLPYPGGKALSMLAQTGTARFKLPKPMPQNLDFSFSGLKTAVRLLIEKEQPLTQETKADIAASFEKVITQSLTDKAINAIRLTGLKRLVVSGGVSANKSLRATLDQGAKEYHFEVFYPRLEYCTDNAAMIALVGALRLEQGFQDSDSSINTFASMQLGLHKT